MTKHRQRRSEPPAAPPAPAAPAPEPKIEEPDVVFASQATQAKPRSEAIADVLKSGPLRTSPEPAPPVPPPPPPPTDIGPAKLLAALAETGTGKAKLKAARDWLMANQSSNTSDFLAAMLTQGIFAEGTINKAQAILASA